MIRVPYYPISQNTNTRAVELWLLLQQHIQTTAVTITMKDLEVFEPIFECYWNACQALGMQIGVNHPLDILENK